MAQALGMFWQQWSGSGGWISLQPSTPPLLSPLHLLQAAEEQTTPLSVCVSVYAPL